MNQDSLQRLAARMMRCGSFGLLLMVCFSGVPAQAGTEVLAYEQQTLTVNGASRTVRVPKGYRLEWLAGMDEPRMLTFAANGDLFAGSHSGAVYRLPPPYTTPEVLVELDDYPHSVAFRGEEILIAQTDGVYSAPYLPGQSSIAPDEVTLLAELPSGGGQDSRTVGVGPDGRVYVSLGIQGNCTDQFAGGNYLFDERRGGVLVLRESEDKASWSPFASGLRNPVGFGWQPQTGVLFASNNGPDHMGNEQPPEYFSRLDAGSFHGMPWFQFDGKKLRRDGCVKSAPPRPINEVTLPVATFPAHSAPLGVVFVPMGALDAQLELDAVVALHGSKGTKASGRSKRRADTPRAPKLVVVRFRDGQAVRVDDLVTGFELPDGKRWARPAGVAVGPDGALYFSSDSDTKGLFRLTRTR